MTSSGECYKPARNDDKTSAQPRLEQSSLLHKADDVMKLLLNKLLTPLALAFLSCQPQGDTPTSGRVAVVASESIAPMIRSEVEEFERIYEKTRIDLSVTSTREAIAQLLRGEVKTVFTPRLLNEEERQIAARYQIQVDTFRIALDGVAVIVHKQNPLAQLSWERLAAIYRGELRVENEMKLLPLALSRNTAAAELFLQKVVRDSVFARPAYVCSTSAQLLTLVAQREDAIGFVGLSWLSDYLRPGDSARVQVKALALAASDTTAPVLLHQSTIYRNEYPLRRTLYCLSTDRSLGVAIGLISFITSAQGQKRVLNAGLVPATMPIKLVKFQS
jgi:phosphate transport system substrate-binding protein